MSTPSHDGPTVTVERSFSVKLPVVATTALTALLSVFMFARSLPPQAGPWRFWLTVTAVALAVLGLTLAGKLDRLLTVRRGARKPKTGAPGLAARLVAAARGTEPAYGGPVVRAEPRRRPSPGPTVTPRPLEDDDTQEQEPVDQFPDPAGSLPVEFRHIVWTAIELSDEQIDELQAAYERHANRSAIFLDAAAYIIDAVEEHPQHQTPEEDPDGSPDNAAVHIWRLTNNVGDGAAVAAAYMLLLDDPDADTLSIVLRPWYDTGLLARFGSVLRNGAGEEFEAEPDGDNVGDLPAFDQFMSAPDGTR